MWQPPWLEQTSLFDLEPDDGIRVWLMEDVEPSPGACWIPDTSEWPSGGEEFLRVSLSEILLRIGPDERYWLSPKACQGILRRANRRGKAQDDDSASTLKQRDHKDATDLVTEAWGMYGASGQEGAALEEQPAITASHGQPGNVAVSTPRMLFVRGGVEVDRHGKKAGKGPLLTDDESATLDAGNHWTLFQPQALDEGVAYDGYNQTLEVGVHRSLRIGRDSSDFVASADTVDYGVRRLTPVECERLQAFPDGWTEPAGSDSARYKAMGNAVTVNTVRWILGRMLEQS